MKIPVISGNVSLYNETRGVAIFPTPVVGMVGLINDVKRHCSSDFKKEGDVVLLLGEAGGDAGLGSGEYLELIHGKVSGSQKIDMAAEKGLHACLIKAAEKGLLSSAHDCSDGGLAVTLAESCILGNIGFKGEIKIDGRTDAALFGEAQSRAVVSLGTGSLRKLEELAYRCKVPVTRLGVVHGSRFLLKGLIDLPVSELDRAWMNGL
jgi:phosphoribosylformylglycinamidine synthase